ncbi:drug resistance transporter, EmrB/QacA subfamily [Paenibacillus sp. UNC496MF]|uniref:DHA2 family efflux MFS transporter permease subunit n=1 Tax=Paenibacillus sp. UNC496MF TaxID=1502753 RepID=UPI0008EB4123|nr:DHA2 family efflux MFS transporter permease subunit [Paenibacillus sp. UNC496MF]SFJ92195.1 drug resistance transporter, EmrB/QacA subfamily [Paenibacillus sp. UNC496MF]
MSQLSHLWDYSPPERITSRSGYHWLVVSTVCIGAFMAALDASIINLALPSLMRQFGIGMAKAEWISLVYLLTLSSLVIPFGRLADMFGRRWMYATGFFVFLVSSVACGVAPGFAGLLVARIFQAIGAAMLQANSVSIITAATPAAHRGKAIGIQASAQGIGLSLGPVIGGALLSLGDWRWLFYVNVPIGIAGTILAVLLLPRDTGRRKESFDYWGLVFLLPALIMMVYVLNSGLAQGWTSPFILLCVFTAMLALASFVREEQRSYAPLMDLSLFRDKIFRYGNLTSFLSFTVMYGVLLLSPFLMETGFRLDAVTAGLYLSLVPIGMTICTPISGYLADRFGVRVPAIGGTALLLLGSGLLAVIHGGGETALLLLGLWLTGCGMGMFTPPNNSQVMGNVPADRLGVAGATLNMSRTMGMGMGITLSGMLYQSALRILPASQEPVNFYAFQASYGLIGLLSAVTLAIWLIRRNAREKYSSEAYIEYHI